MKNKQSYLWRKIKILITLFFFYCYLPFRKKKSSIGSTDTFVVVQTAKLGDMVCATPVFREIKKKYPDCRLIVICNEINRQLLSGNPYVDSIQSDSISSYWLRQQNISLAILLNTNFEWAARLFFANINTIVVPEVRDGYSPFMTRAYKRVLPHLQTYARHLGVYAPLENLHALSVLNIQTNNTKKELFYTKEAEQEVQKYFTEDGTYIGLSLTAGNRIKEWPIERFVAFIEKVLETDKDVHFIIIGGPQDKEYAITFLDMLQHADRVTDTVADLSVEHMKALIAKLDMFIGVDTGPIYVAEAFEVPTIDIIGPVDEREQPPVSEQNIVLYDTSRTEAAVHILNARDYDEEEALRQVNAVTSEMLFDAYQKLKLNLR